MAYSVGIPVGYAAPVAYTVGIPVGRAARTLGIVVRYGPRTVGIAFGPGVVGARSLRHRPSSLPLPTTSLPVPTGQVRLLAAFLR